MVLVRRRNDFVEMLVRAIEKAGTVTDKEKIMKAIMKSWGK